MAVYLINQLHFITNTEMVLKYIRAGHVHDDPPPEFSLNAVRSMPDALHLPLTQDIVSLSAMNISLPELNESVRRVVRSEIIFGASEKSPEGKIRGRIAAARKTAAAAPDIQLIDRAVSNYEQYGFFSQYDWRFANWGTVEDIHSVTPETFRPPTSYLEFTTRWTPPVAAVQELANTFPSVRFKLKYRYDPNTPWTVEDIFAFPPFGY